MAAKKSRRKRTKPAKVPVVLLFVSGIVVAVLAWFFWNELGGVKEPLQKKVASKRTREVPPEEISDKDRKNLDRLLSQP